MLEFKIKIPLALALYHRIYKGLDWECLFRSWKTVDLSFCLTVPSGYANMLALGEYENKKEKNTFKKRVAFAEKKSRLPNKSFVSMVTWSFATFLI